MQSMSYKELYECGMNFETYVGTGTKSERLRIPKNYLRIDIGEVVEELEKVEEKYYFLCVGEMWCPDCQLNLTVLKRMTEINTNLEMSIVTRGRGQKFLSELLDLEEVKIPTVVLLDENFEKVGVFLEQPKRVKEVPNYDEIELDYLKGKYLKDTAKDIMKLIKK